MRLHPSRSGPLTVLVRVVGAVSVAVAELVTGPAEQPVQTELAAGGTALGRGAVGGVQRHVVVGTPARPGPRHCQAQVLAISVIHCASVGTCQRKATVI